MKTTDLARTLKFWGISVATVLASSCSPVISADLSAHAIESYEIEIVGTEEPDILEGTSADEKLVGLASRDLLQGSGGKDTFVGGPGEDMLSGGTGADTYVFSIGDGPDIVKDAGGDNDRIVFTDGIRSGDVRITEEAGGLRVTRENTRDTVIIVDWRFDHGLIERFIFSDVELQSDEIEARISGNRRPRAYVDYSPQTARVGRPFEMVLSADTFSDPDLGDELKFSIEPSGAPHPYNWLTVDFEKLVLSGTPGKDDIGKYKMRFNATDEGYLEATVELVISVVD